MTKHIVGLVLFTFIIGTSAVIAGLFGDTPKNMNSFVIGDSHKVYKRKKRRKRRCRKRRERPHFFQKRLISTGITQAVFDANTGLLTTSHAVKAANRGAKRGYLVYHFYVKNEFGTKHVRSERVLRAFKSSNMMSGFRWLNNQRSKDNLYIISEYKRFRHGWREPLEFDESRAIPILIKGID